MNTSINVTLSSEQSAKRSDYMARIAKLEAEKARIIARMNRPHFVAARWIRMRLIHLFN